MTHTPFRHCRFERDGAIATITLDRPEVLNALHPEAHYELARAFDLYAAEPDLHVAIITGAGDRAFRVGTDLKALATTQDQDKPPTGFAGITMRYDLWKPVIAAVNGPCLGGGVEIRAACDLAIAADHAEFGLPEPRVGLAALGGGALQRLARDLPMKHAMGLVLTGRRISSAEAMRIGLVNDVVPQPNSRRGCARCRRTAGLRAAFAPGVQAGDVAKPRRARSRVGNEQTISGGGAHAGERRRARRSESVRRETQAPVERSLKRR